MVDGGNLLRREVLRQQGVLPPEFPQVGQFSGGQVATGRVDKVGVSGDVDKEPEDQGMFQSPAQAVFGRNVRDFIPVLPYKYEPR